MLSITGVLVSFASGIFGAALGAASSFTMVGFLVLGGVFIQAASGAGQFLSQVSFGVWGPHVGGFAAGVAAAAYAARKGELDHDGNDLGFALMGLNQPDVLLMGGVFGIGGYLFNLLVSLPGPWTDTVALTVVVSGVASRILFGGTNVLGRVPDGESRFRPSGHHKPLQLIIIGLGAGVLSGYLAIIVPNGAGVPLCFGLAAASLIFAQLGLKVPVTHHIVLPAALASAASGSILWGAVFGIVSSLFGEISGNLFNTWGDTHIDPPAITIFIMTSVSIILNNSGIYGLVPVL